MLLLLKIYFDDDDLCCWVNRVVSICLCYLYCSVYFSTHNFICFNSSVNHCNLSVGVNTTVLLQNLHFTTSSTNCIVLATKIRRSIWMTHTNCVCVWKYLHTCVFFVSTMIKCKTQLVFKITNTNNKNKNNKNKYIYMGMISTADMNPQVRQMQSYFMFGIVVPNCK